MSNPFYTASGNPGTRAQGASQTIRTEFEAIQDGFDMFPAVLTANKALVVNAGGTAVELTVGSLALAGNFTTLGAYALTLTATGATSLTLPTTGTLSTLAGAETLTNKTISGANNTLSNIGNSSLTNSSITINGSAVSLGGSVTVTAVASSIVVGTTAITSGTTTRVLYNNGGTLGEYSVSGSGSVAMTTSPTLTTPTISGALTYGGVTLSASVTGTGSMVLATSPTLTTPTISGALTYGGVTLSASVTGTGSMVLATSPTLSSTLRVTTSASGNPDIKVYDTTGGGFGIFANGSSSGTFNLYGANTAGNFVATWLTVNASGMTLPSALTYGGVTLSNSVTGTGSMVLSASPTLTGTLTIGTPYTASGLSIGVNIGDNKGIRATNALFNNGLSAASSHSVAWYLNYNAGWVYNVGSGTAYAAQLYFNAVTGAFSFQNTAAAGSNGAAAGLQTPFSVAASGGLTLNYALTYGGVTLSNSVTGTGSMVLSASPTISGTLSTAAQVITVADGAYGLKVAGATGKLRFLGYNGGAAYIDAANTAEGAYQPLVVNGSTLYLQGNGVSNITVTQTGVSVAAALTYGGVTLSNSVTGTGSMVLSANATVSALTNTGVLTVNGVSGANSFVVNNTGATKYFLINPEVSANTAYIGYWTGAAFGTLQNPGATVLSGALTYGGVTLSNSVTGTGSMVLSQDAAHTGLTTFTRGIDSWATSFFGAVGSDRVNIGTLSGVAIIGANNNAGSAWAAFKVDGSTLGLNTVTGGTTTIGGALTYGGVTLSNSVTGTGSMVLSASPTLTGTLTVPTINSSLGALKYNGTDWLVVSTNYSVLFDPSGAAKLWVGNATDPSTYYRNTVHSFQTVGGGATLATLSTSGLTLPNALTYGGVTLSNSVTGTGSMVLSASPTFTGTPLSTTAAQATNNTQVATTAYADRVAVQQVVSTITGAVATGTTLIPLDDTAPQNTEGDQYMSLAITPKSATSKLIIDVVFNGSTSVGSDLIVALFQDSTASALATADTYIDAAGGRGCVTFRHVMTSGTTSATTFKVRAGGSNAGTLTFNGVSGGRLYGGVMASSIVITEVGI